MNTTVHWMGAVASPRGPQNYTMRLMLLAIGTRFLAQREDDEIRLSYDDLAAITGLSKSWLHQQTKNAVAEGWLTRQTDPSSKTGLGWRTYWYAPKFPAMSRPAQVAATAEARV